MVMCGYISGCFEDESRTNWQNNGCRPIQWSAWYPTDEPGSLTQTGDHFFDLGVVATGAKCAGKSCPVILLSHGTGGTAESLGWIGRSMAAAGFVVVGVNHHGNTGIEPYLPEGFLCWWERAADISALLSKISSLHNFDGKLNLDEVSVIGFSLGAHTVLSLLGAQTDIVKFSEWQKSFGVQATGPREFPDLEEQIPVLQQNSVVFAQSWERHGSDFQDSRIGHGIAIAPPPPIRSFKPRTIANIQQPLTILTAGNDQEAPANIGVDWLVQQNNRFEHQSLGKHVGHYTFLEMPANPNLLGELSIFSDHQSVNRADIHRETIGLIKNLLSTQSLDHMSAARRQI